MQLFLFQSSVAVTAHIFCRSGTTTDVKRVQELVAVVQSLQVLCYTNMYTRRILMTTFIQRQHMNYQ